MKYKFQVPGEAKPKSRPRATVANGRAILYTPRNTVVFENKVGMAFKEWFFDAKPLTKHVSITIVFHFPLNKTDYTAKGNVSKKGEMKLNGEIKHVVKPDLDNLIKAVQDGLNGIAYLDDSLIFEVKAKKKYSMSPFTEITIEGE